MHNFIRDGIKNTFTVRTRSHAFPTVLHAVPFTAVPKGTPERVPSRSLSESSDGYCYVNEPFRCVRERQRVPTKMRITCKLLVVDRVWSMVWSDIYFSFTKEQASG